MINLTPEQKADLRRRIRIMLTPDIDYEIACDLADNIGNMVEGWMKMNLSRVCDHEWDKSNENFWRCIKCNAYIYH